MANIFIATPMYGGMCAGLYTQSLIKTIGMLTHQGHYVSAHFMFNESLITRARNNLAHQFLQSDATHMLWLDADIKWEPEYIPRMIEADKDIIGGIYPKKEINWESVRQAVQAGKSNLANHTGSFVVNLPNDVPRMVVEKNEPAEVANIGTGFMLVKREVYEQMKAYTPTYTSDMTHLSGQQIYAFFQDTICPESNRWLSEDYFFCKTWRDHGGKVFAAPWCDLGHIGTYTFDGRLVEAPPDDGISIDLSSISGIALTDISASALGTHEIWID